MEYFHQNTDRESPAATRGCATGCVVCAFTGTFKPWIFERFARSIRQAFPVSRVIIVEECYADGITFFEGRLPKAMERLFRIIQSNSRAYGPTVAPTKPPATAVVNSFVS